jgi:hypothetical protein
MRRRWKSALVFAFGFALFAWGIERILELRFARGDVYPPYSTLRGDPLGAKVFLESLGRLGIEVQRNDLALESAKIPAGAALFFLGVHLAADEEKTILRLEDIVRSGVRAVIGFYPRGGGELEGVVRSGPTPTATVTPSASEEPEWKWITARQLARRWGFTIEHNKSLINAPAEARQPGLDPALTWHSALHFKGSSADWHVIYALRDYPVVMERRFGNGSIVLCSDSFLFSNEAMLRERHPRALAWFADARSPIIFDEAHLGIAQEPGVATLLRRYGLGGFILGLLCLAALLAWKKNAVLIPRRASTARQPAPTSGNDAFSGMVNLLRRNIAPRDLLRTCLAEWKTTAPARQLARFAGAEPAEPVEPVRSYNETARAMHPKQWSFPT